MILERLFSYFSSCEFDMIYYCEKHTILGKHLFIYLRFWFCHSLQMAENIIVTFLVSFMYFLVNFFFYLQMFIVYEVESFIKLAICNMLLIV